jgi:membrane protein implicated in regulation of membrane protease activity
MPKRQTTPSGPELFSEVSDLAAGVGMLIFALAPLALPALALMALAVVALLIPALVGAVLAASFLLVRRWWRSRDRVRRDTKPARSGNGEMRRLRSDRALGRSVVPYPVELDHLTSQVSRSPGEVS